MELEELRQRLLLRSKSAVLPTLTNPVQISDVALSQAASKLKWETTLSPVEIADRLGISGAKTEAHNDKSARASRVEKAPAEASGADREPAREASADLASSKSSGAVTEPLAQAEPISILTGTVDQLSEPAEAFREHFERLGKLMEPIDTATEITRQAQIRVAGLFEHLSSLAGNLQSVKAFAEQVKTLSASFEPMKGLKAQIDEVMQALYANVKEASATLDPIKTFQGKVRKLMDALDSIEKLEGQLSDLAEAFRPASGDAMPPRSEAVPEKAAQCAHAS